MGAHKNRCAVSSHPAGHPMACGDCDPCMLGSAPELWCRQCDGDGWVFDSPADHLGGNCPRCAGSGFEPSSCNGAISGPKSCLQKDLQKEAGAERETPSPQEEISRLNPLPAIPRLNGGES